MSLSNTYRNDEVNKPFVNVPDSAWHFTPLHYACCYNNKEIIQRLLYAGADPNARYYSLTYAWYKPDHFILRTSHAGYTRWLFTYVFTCVVCHLHLFLRLWVQVHE